MDQKSPGSTPGWLAIYKSRCFDPSVMSQNGAVIAFEMKTVRIIVCV